MAIDLQNISQTFITSLYIYYVIFNVKITKLLIYRFSSSEAPGFQFCFVIVSLNFMGKTIIGKAICFMEAVSSGISGGNNSIY